MSTPRDEDERKRLLEAEAEIFGKTMGFTTTPTPEQMERTISMKVNVQEDAPAPDATVRLASPPPQHDPAGQRPDQAGTRKPAADAATAKHERNPLDALDNLDDLDALLGDDAETPAASASAADSDETDDIDRALAGLGGIDDATPKPAPPEGEAAASTGPEQQAFDELDLGTEEISLTEAQIEHEEATAAEPDDHETTITEAAYDFALNNRAPQPKGRAAAGQDTHDHIEEITGETMDFSAPSINSLPASGHASAPSAATEPPEEPAEATPEMPATETERSGSHAVPDAAAAPPGFTAMPPAGDMQPVVKPSIWPAWLALLALIAAGGAGWLAFQQNQRADMLEARLKQLEHDVLRARAKPAPAADADASAATAALETRLDDFQRQLDELTQVVSARLMPPPAPASAPARKAARKADTQPARAAPRPATTPSATASGATRAAATPPQASAQGQWIVNISSVTSQEAAQKELARMRALGVQAEAAPVEIRGRTWYRIRISGLPDKATATQRAKEIGEALGIGDIWISRAR